MQQRLLEIMICPSCGVTDFSIEIDGEDEQHVMEGQLTCGTCDRIFPIRSGVPRMLPDELLEEGLRDPNQSSGGKDGSASTRTMRSFGYQWNVFSEVYKEWRNDFYEFVSPVDEKFFEGKQGLDVGCGMGRYTRVVGETGAEIVGLDLSNAVEAAFQNTRHLPNVHIVQGDVLQPPFFSSSFDFAYSIGVLHHLPEPRRGFESLRRLTRPGGGVIIWVYSKTKHPVYTLIRKFTLKLPFRPLRLLCLFLAAGLWVFFILPNKVARALGFDAVADRIKFQRYARFPFRALHTDLFDELSAPVIHGHSEPEIREWYLASDCSQVVTSATGKHGWRGFGIS